MNFVKILFFLIALKSSWVLAESPFAVSAPLSSTNEKSEVTGAQELSSNALVARLKQDAVVLWLRQYLKDSASRFEKLVTPELAESYILDYQLAQKGTNKDILELSGHLDTEALKGWVRLIETKGKGGSELRPLLVTTDSVNLSPPLQSSFSSLVLSLLNQEAKKLNLKIMPATGSYSAQPPRSEKEIMQLRNSLPQESGNTVIWMHLTQCRTCEFPRLDLFLYSLNRGALISSVSEELSLPLRQWDQTEKLKAGLVPISQQFHQELEKAISSGKFTASPLTITIEGIDNYLAYRKLESLLSKQTYLSDWFPKAFVQNTAQFEAISQLGAQEVAQRIENLQSLDAKLSPVRVDSRNIVMRYSR